MKLKLSFLTAFFICFFVTTNIANAATFKSGKKQAALVELYTSEGCSSCPPAEEWLNDLQNVDNLWNTVVPVAFHVDYWDYIGWQDEYADKSFSQRQRRYAQENGERTVYTPGIRIGGKEFRNWRHADLNQLEKGSKVGVLKVDINKEGHMIASFDSLLKGFDNYEIHYALLGMGLKTDVKRGENRGVTLHHDFIVLEHNTLKQEADKFTGKTNLNKYQNIPLAVAVWVNDKQDLTPVQATGGYLSFN